MLHGGYFLQSKAKITNSQNYSLKNPTKLTIKYSKHCSTVSFFPPSLKEIGLGQM